MALKGIDVSEWQTGLDYTTMSRSLDFVILREGYRQTRDRMFLTHVNGFKAARVPIIGVYHFIYALNNAAARQEALNCIKNVEAAGLPKTIRIWCDFEYDTVTNAKKKGVNLGSAECILFSNTFCKTVQEAGYPTGIYTNMDYYRHMYGSKINYPLWLADYSGAPDIPCLIQQYSSTGRIPGFYENLDMNYLYDKAEIERVQGVAQTAPEPVIARVATEEEREALIGMNKNEAINKVLAIAEAEVGYLEKASNAYLDSKTANAGAGNYTKYGRDMHNIQPSNMDFPAPYCDAFVDWTFCKAFGVPLARQMLCGDFDDYTVISADYYKRAGRWYTSPQRGDQAFFRNSGGICHTGLVLNVTGRKVYTIEGNVSNRVMKKSYYLGDSYIAGYGRPKYELAVTVSSPTTQDILTDGTSGKTIEQLAQEVLAGKWGNGDDRKRRLTQAGISYEAVQAKVNELLKVGTAAQTPGKTVTELAKEVIAGKWGNGDDRKKRLTAAGHDYNAVQKEVNRLLKG